MEILTDDHSNGKPLWNGNHAVIATDISPDGTDITFWNSHGGDGKEIRQLDKLVYNYLIKGKVNFYLLCPQDFVNNPINYYIELYRIRDIRHLLR